MVETLLIVGMAEVKVTRDPTESLAALGLGSCIGICAFEAAAKVAGLAHVVLPENYYKGVSCENRGKFADTAVPFLLEQMARLGANRLQIRAALVGGAQIFGGSQGGLRLDIGMRNIQAVRFNLEREAIPVVAEDTGGSFGRTVYLSFPNGRVVVRTIGHGEKELVVLGNMR